MTQRIILSLMIALLAWPAAPALAQEAPVPHKQPRLPVSRQVLASGRQSAPLSRDITGQALILDGEKLRIGDVEMRLFGVVPPQLSANFGPQARAELDTLAAGNAMHCQIRDRDHEGNFLATCRNASNLDAALELLKHGLAVAARGSLADTELATPYITAEQYAQTQKIGLWSLTVASAVPTPVVQPVSLPLPVVTPSVAKVEAPVAKIENVVQVPPVSVTNDLKRDKTDKIGISPVPVVNEAAATRADNINFFARYQLLLTGLVMLLTALSISGVLFIQRRIERREEMRALAAALRGELMAARALCQGRLKAIMTESDDRNMTWPRIRSTLYQAYVGRIGWLGAELARQVASLYGQSNDYAAYYQPVEALRAGDMPKRHALQTMMHHIEEVLPKLALIEETGKRLPAKSSMTALHAPRAIPQIPIELDSIPLPLASLAAPTPASSTPPHPSSQSTMPPVTEVRKAETKSEAQIVKPLPPVAVTHERSETPSVPKALASELGASQDKAKDAVRETLANLTKATPPLSAPAAIKPVNPPVVRAKTEEIKVGVSTVESGVKSTGYKAEDGNPVAQKPVESTSPQNSVPLWDVVRKFARDHLPDRQSAPIEEALPDYAALIEEDMSNFTFGESEYDFYDESLDEPVTKFSSNHRG